MTESAEAECSTQHSYIKVSTIFYANFHYIWNSIQLVLCILLFEESLQTKLPINEGFVDKGTNVEIIFSKPLLQILCSPKLCWHLYWSSVPACILDDIQWPGGDQEVTRRWGWRPASSARSLARTRRAPPRPRGATARRTATAGSTCPSGRAAPARHTNLDTVSSRTLSMYLSILDTDYIYYLVFKSFLYLPSNKVVLYPSILCSLCVAAV